MFNGTLLVVAATVILVLYHKVKVWDEQQVRLAGSPERRRA